MRYRYSVSDGVWERIAPLLPGRAETRGVTAKDNRLFIDAVLWIARTGAPWRDLPERYGKWNPTYRRFQRWAIKGVWEKIMDHFSDPDLSQLLIDSTIVRAHQHAAGAPKKTGSRPLEDQEEDFRPRSTRQQTRKAKQ